MIWFVLGLAIGAALGWWLPNKAMREQMFEQERQIKELQFMLRTDETE